MTQTDKEKLEEISRIVNKNLQGTSEQIIEGAWQSMIDIRKILEK